MPCKQHSECPDCLAEIAEKVAAAEEAEHIRFLRVAEYEIKSAIDPTGGWLESPKEVFSNIALYTLSTQGALAGHDLAIRREERRKALEEAITVARTTPLRCHADDDVDFHSGCIQTRDSIRDAIRTLLDAERQPEGSK